MRIILTSIIAVAAGPALADTYTFKPLPAGFTASALNNVGQIAGLAYSASAMSGAPAIYAADSLTFVPNIPDSPGGVLITGLNDAGDVLGLSDRGRSPFLIVGGARMSVSAPGGTSGGADAAGLNDALEVVGSALVISSPSVSTLHGFISSGGAYTYLDFPGAPTYAMSISNNGHVAGSYVTGQLTTSGFVYDAGRFTTVNDPNAANTELNAINDAGEVAGIYEDSSAAEQGFTEIGGVFTEVVGPDGSPFLPIGIDDAGQLIGTFGFTGLSYLATPMGVPEPAGLWLLAGGVAAIGALARQRPRPTTSTAGGT